MVTVDHLLARLHLLPLKIAEPSYGMRQASTLCSYSLFERLSPAEMDDFVAAATRVVSADRAMGCLVGMAVGDAVGHPLEFLPVVDPPAVGASSFHLRDLTYTHPLNRFGLKPGQ